MRELLTLTRRSLLAVPVVLAGMALPTAANAETLTVFSHAVHQRVLSEGPAGSVVGEWEEETGNTVEWVTFGVPEVHERLFRELALDSTELDVAYLLNRFTEPELFNLLEPLDELMAANPIEGFEGISPSLVASLTVDGKLYGIPIRHATHGLIYNEALLQEKGYDGPPETFEELLEMARALTYTREDGTQVHGLIFGGPQPAGIIDVIRVFGGDFVTEDFEVKADSPETIQGVQTLVDLFSEGVLPTSFIAFTTEDAVTFMQQGRAAMIIEPMDRVAVFGNAENSQYPGGFKAVPVPPLAANAGTPVAVKTEFWSLVIPRNAENKELSWSLIRHVATEEAMLRQAINGNGATRAAVFEDPQILERVPYAPALAQAVSVARVPMPGFKGSAQADDAIKEEIQLALTGSKTAAQAMEAAASRVRAILGQ